MNGFQDVLRRLFPKESPVATEVEHIAFLKKAASTRRAEYVDLERSGEPASDAASLARLVASRKLMEEADTAHMVALQRWQNRQDRQKSF
jgi:hypothetical protein